MTSRSEIYNNRSTPAQLPLYGVYSDNIFTDCCTSERYLNKLTSLYDLDVYDVDIRSDLDVNPDHNVMNNHIKCKKYSPESFIGKWKRRHGLK